jgi:hypothetical protein
VTHTTISKTEESSHEHIKTQDNGHHFFYSRWVVHKEFVPPGVTVNKKYYLEVLDRLRKRVMRVRMEIADDSSFITTTRPHTALSVCVLMTK